MASASSSSSSRVQPGEPGSGSPDWEGELADLVDNLPGGQAIQATERALASLCGTAQLTTMLIKSRRVALAGSRLTTVP